MSGAGTLEAALGYAARGWPVFPLGANKRPLRLCAECERACPGRDGCTCPVDTCHGFYAATTDPARVRRWWGEHPAWQLAVRTGAPSGLVALDVDPAAGGTGSLSHLEQRVGVLPGTLQQVTGSGGLHLVYAHPGYRVGNSAGKLGPGLDVRGDGGYIVAAPTVHPRARLPYAWHGGWRVLDEPGAVAPWPAGQFDEVLVPTPAPQPVLLTGRRGPAPVVKAARRFDGLLRFIEAGGGAEGDRNFRVHWAACRAGEMVARGEIGETEAAAELLEVGRRVGLKDDELIGRGAGGTIYSGLSTGRGVAA